MKYIDPDGLEALRIGRAAYDSVSTGVSDWYETNFTSVAYEDTPERKYLPLINYIHDQPILSATIQNTLLAPAWNLAAGTINTVSHVQSGVEVSNWELFETAAIMTPASKTVTTSLNYLGSKASAWVGNKFRSLTGKQLPWQYGDTNGALGTTDKFGNITIKPGLKGDKLAETIRHESVHRFLSPKAGPFSKVRADFGMTAYQESHLVRYVEEAAAEVYATGSLQKGPSFPLTHGYVRPANLAIVRGITIINGTMIRIN